MEVLRFATAGSVDDGKSTLIGRLLYDSRQVFEDQWQAIERTSVRRGDDHVNLALLTDGLRAEREQGITIDVAYRYFSTPKRKFILADTPGHVQYTRNMVTGVSTADVAVILVDVRKGVVEQSRRHAFIAALMRVPHLVVCVNKMDLVDHQRAPFEAVVEQFERLAEGIDLPDRQFIPVSALHGDNVVVRSARMGWYTGPTLLEHLEALNPEPTDVGAARFPVQYVIRPQSRAFPDYRGYAGRIAGGVFRLGDRVLVLPSGRTTTLVGIDLFGRALCEARAPASVTLRLEDEIDVGRGDMLCDVHAPARVGQEFSATVCWMHERPVFSGSRWLLKHTSRTVKAVVVRVEDRLDVNTLEHVPSPPSLGLNDLGRIVVRTSAPLAWDAYRENRTTGSFILIDEASNATVAAGMIDGPTNT